VSFKKYRFGVFVSQRYGVDLYHHFWAKQRLADAFFGKNVHDK